MCGRFAMLMLLDDLARMFAALPANDLPFSPNYNICPTDNVSVVMHRDRS
ncbi:MAG: SOS response-associated peptidase [Marinosulfonomonas sp.]|nr:SOS response-associated peptidase [Marinosulfonomonas sp.]